MKELVVAGDPIEHSLSPVMQNAAIEEMGLENEFVYKKKQVKKEDLPKFIDYLKNIEGANITIPHKVQVLRYLDELTKEAEFIGAVNTIYKKDGNLVGHNTDGQGAVEAVLEKTTIESSKACIIGAGGAARAIAFTMALYNIKELIIMNRTVGKAQELSKEINQKTSTNCTASPLSKNVNADIIINTTSLGMKGDKQNQTPIEAKNLQPDMTVMDIVYNPLETKLLKDAKEAGCTIIDGVGMFVNQGALALEKWTNKKAPRKIMRNAVMKSLNG